MTGSQYISFPHEHHQLDWSKVLCSKFGVFKGLNVWVAVTQCGLFDVSILDGLFCEYQYLQILDDVVLPYLEKNKNLTYLQESNVFTTSDIVRSWFELHPEVKCITWPANCEVISPISIHWKNMTKYVNDNFWLNSCQAKKLIRNFWTLLQEPSSFQNSFANTASCLEKVKKEHLAFAHDHLEVDWKKLLFSKFGVVRCVNVWAAGTSFGPFKISLSNGLVSEARYIQILNDIVLPFLIDNSDFSYVQESNEITKSESVRSWFQMRPDMKCITWAPIISPMSKAWDDMNQYVDENFPLTSNEIKRFISEFWETTERENPNYYLDSFNHTKNCLVNVMQSPLNQDI